MKKVYLAGPVMHAPDDGMGWRDGVKLNWDDAGIEWVDPVEELEYDEDEHAPEHVIKNDKALLDECDGVLVGLTRHHSIGTWREVEYAVEVLDIPVVVWYQPEGTREPLNERNFSPWLDVFPIYSGFKTVLARLKTEMTVAEKEEFVGSGPGEWKEMNPSAEELFDVEVEDDE